MEEIPQENDITSFRRTKHNSPLIEKHPYNIEDGNLTLKQELFVHYYVSDDVVGTKGNKTAAAKAAGFPEASAHSVGWELCQMPKVQAAIDDYRSQLFQELNIRPLRTLNELAAIAHSNVMDYYNADGSLRNLKTLPRHITAAIKEVKVSAVQGSNGQRMMVQEVKLHDKKPALELIGKHQKLFTEVFEWEPGENAAAHDEKAKETQAQMVADLRAEQEAEEAVERAMQEGEG